MIYIHSASIQEITTFSIRVKTFTKKKNVLPTFATFDSYLGEGANIDSMIALLGYREGDVTRHVTHWKDDLEETQV
ncbi:translationally controlled tumor-associated [Penicillium sp. IBT 16267x]|nr:translationally controlled tumor-associated [Penicillium sp. IBT 16267x]